VIGHAIPWEGKTVGVVAVRNIKDRKEAESARHVLEHQLFQAERLATVGTVASGIVHNLKNPLTGILGFAELLKMKYPEEAFITHILDASKQMNEMIENILIKGRRQQKHEGIDLHHLLRREVEFLETDLFFKHKIETHVSFDDQVPSFWGTYTDLSQIFGNLLRNAVEAMHDCAKKELRITTYVKDNDICVEIQDTGCGIPEAGRATLFDPFVTSKVGDGKTSPQGTGLGLYMVYQLLK
jgi:two-component system NtrC family sensor kinase